MMVSIPGVERRDFLIEIQKAVVFRGDLCVFQDLSLSIPVGCHTVILGPNGSGKTTLLKLFSREIYAVEREDSFVRLFGKENWNVWDLRTQMGILSAELQGEYPGYATGMDTVLSGFFSSLALYDHHRVSPYQRAKSYEVMQWLGVDHLQDRPFQKMSTGEQRRVLLGRVLIHDPQTLILDEPTTGLDVQGCFQYLECVRKCIRQGKTLILVTHHLHEIPPEVTRVLFLKEGKVIEDGPKKEMLTPARVSNLFDIPIHLVQREGWYQAVPSEDGWRED